MNRLRIVQHQENIARGSFTFIDSAKLAHDLKGPLNSIKGLLMIAESEVNDEKALHYLKLIEKYQELLYSRVNDALSKIKGTDNKAAAGLGKSIFSGNKPSLVSANVNGFSEAGFGSQADHGVRLTEKSYQLNSILSVMKILQCAYLNKSAGRVSEYPNIDLTKLVHDIKRPLNLIGGLLELALFEVENELAKSYFKLIGKCRQQLYSRVEETIKRFHKEDGATQAVKINFNKIVGDIQSSLAHMEGFSEIEHKVDIQNKRLFYSDADAIYSIIQNLYENAIKYRKHDASSHVVSLEILDTDAGIKIQISDNGIGIRKELFSEIFKFRVRDESTPENGHGIGLALVKQLTKRLGGRIGLDSEFGEGTTFTVNIPDGC